VVETFVGQFYLQGSQMRTLPSEILLDFNLDDKTLLADSLSELAGRRVNVQTKPRGDRARYLKLARTNAATALTTKLAAVDGQPAFNRPGNAPEIAGSETYGVFRHQPYDG
jgi:excinuclease ABC subunit C